MSITSDAISARIQYDFIFIKQVSMKVCLLLAILLIGIFSQAEEVLVYSNTSIILESVAENKTFAEKFKINIPVPDQNYSQAANNTSYNYSTTRKDAQWAFTDGKVLFPRVQKLFPMYWVSKYKICICNYCPTTTSATLYVRGTGYFVLTSASGAILGSGHIFFNEVKVSLTNLKCGCDNVFYLYLYNYFPSYLGIYYYVSQPITSQCQFCNNTALQYYNYATCTCSCMAQFSCLSPQVYNSATCQCGCINKLVCSSLQYPDYQTCSCKCKPKCCALGQALNASCQCAPGSVSPKLPTASLSVDGNCMKEEEACPPPTIWSQDKCDCTTP